ncbi:hypothetical protein [Hymenobacter jejuensis]|uniref:STAS/SEC14 domain-containing protein n=1 Tax=Hymenobacter jejuensis TaxID=2502781 RepID=A0A5B8A0F9_9BACT|nr:hypothetical protein [Hymenobacter jejuensis]QDA60559.1 hypothetical protein FHG12_10765 [Hymenobacter jejuensis]
MAILSTTPFLRIHLHEPTALLEVEWLDFVQGEPLREALLDALRLAHLHHVRAGLCDTKLMRTIRPTDQDWIVQRFIPELATLPLKRLALVWSSDALNRMGVSHVMQRCSHLLTCETEAFDSRSEAFLWVTAGSAAPQSAVLSEI